jgi:TRAP-type C4-dicarboxylate transport system permease small subunit
VSALVDFITRVEKAAAALAALSLLALFLVGLAEIVLRTFAGYSLPISLEYSGYLVAASFLLGSGWTLNQGRHVRLSLFKQSAALDRLSDAVAFALALALSFGLAAWAWGSFIQHQVSYYPSATPLWIPQSALALGALVLSLSLLKRLMGGKP